MVPGITVMGATTFSSTDRLVLFNHNEILLILKLYYFFITYRVIVVSRNGVSLTSGDSYTEGEILTVALSVQSGGQNGMYLESSGGATFMSGENCGGGDTRLDNKPTAVICITQILSSLDFLKY
jgi:hypothetical protein